MYSSTHSFTSAVVGGEWSASRAAALPQGKHHNTHWIDGWVAPRTSQIMVSNEVYILTH